MFRRGYSNSLFRGTDLGAYLRARAERLQEEINGLSFAELQNIEDSKAADEFANRHSIKPPVLKESEIKVDASEGPVTVGGRRSGFIDDREYTVTGLHLTVKVPFDGESELFKCQPSTYSLSGTPDGDIRNNELILTYQTAEKDADKINALWEKDVRDIKQNLEWVSKDVSGYNSSIINTIRTTLANRKKQAGESQSLIDKLKR